MKKLLLALVILSLPSSAFAQAMGRNVVSFGPGSASWSAACGGAGETHCLNGLWNDANGHFYIRASNNSVDWQFNGGISPLAAAATNTAGASVTVSAQNAGTASAAVGTTGGSYTGNSGSGASSIGQGAGNAGSWTIFGGFGGDANASDGVVGIIAGSTKNSTAGYGGDFGGTAGRGGAAAGPNVGARGASAFLGGGPGGSGSATQVGGDGGDTYVWGGPGGASAGANGGNGGGLYLDAGPHGYSGSDGNVNIATRAGLNVVIGAPIQYSNPASPASSAVSWQNVTAATATTTVQYSPIEEFIGQAWSTGSSASQTVKWAIQDIASSGASVSSKLSFSSSENGAGYSQRGFIDSFGNIASAADLYTSGGAGTGTVRAAALNPNSGTVTVFVGTQHTANIQMGGSGIPLNRGQGTVTQATSITTGVTVNTVTFIVTTVSATTAAGATSTFTVTNSSVTAASTPVCTLDDYSGTFGTNGTPMVSANTVALGSFKITIYNAHASNALSGTLKISCHVD